MKLAAWSYRVELDLKKLNRTTFVHLQCLVNTEDFVPKRQQSQQWVGRQGPLRPVSSI